MFTELLKILFTNLGTKKPLHSKILQTNSLILTSYKV